MQKERWIIVVIFAAAMAWGESAAVLYLRTLIDRVEPYQPDPLPVSVGLGQIELVREAATLVMLCAVGWLAGRTPHTRVAYAAIAFGAWDILYYVFLVPMSGWPHSLFDWDILFLLPLPWWGPVLAPALIAALMIVGGTVITQVDQPYAPLLPRRFAWGLATIGAALALYTFMADAICVTGEGSTAIRNVLPTRFNWQWFIVALTLLAAPIIDLSWQLYSRKNNFSFGKEAFR